MKKSRFLDKRMVDADPNSSSVVNTGVVRPEKVAKCEEINVLLNSSNDSNPPLKTPIFLFIKMWRNVKVFLKKD